MEAIESFIGHIIAYVRPDMLSSTFAEIIANFIFLILSSILQILIFSALQDKCVIVCSTFQFPLETDLTSFHCQNCKG